jgi:hypothetical protein
MKSANFKIKKTNCIFLSLYDIIVISVIALTIVSAITIWIWYGYKDAQIENQLQHIK